VYFKLPEALGRDRRSTPFPTSAIRSGRLFLGGLLASIARLRFADDASIKLLPDRKEAFIIGWKQWLNCLCQPRGQAHVSTFSYMQQARTTSKRFFISVGNSCTDRSGRAILY